MSNLSAVLYGPSDLRMEKLTIPCPGDHEVLIETKIVGICGSDLHVWKDFGFADQKLSEPVVLGHECSGVVVKVGGLVSGLHEGDRVAIEPGVPCKECQVCRLGRYNLCDRVNNPIHGVLAQYFVHPADFCFKLPQTVSFEEGALVEPLSVAIHACNRAEVSPGQTILICGSGTIGLLCLLTAKARGVAKVYITDVDNDRLTLAKQLGADKAILIRHDQMEVSQQLDDQPDISFECSGALASVKFALESTKTGGSVILVGFGPSEIQLPLLNSVISREVDIKGSFSYANCYPTAISTLEKRKINVKPLVTHKYSLEDTLKAFEMSESRGQKVLKVMIHC